VVLANKEPFAWPGVVVCHAEGVAQDLATAAANYRAAQKAVDDAKAAVAAGQAKLREARSDLNESIVAEARRGTRMRDLVAVTGLSREWVRTLLRAAGVEPE
jgi:GAF domain-containing protein